MYIYVHSKHLVLEYHITMLVVVTELELILILMSLPKVLPVPVQH